VFWRCADGVMGLWLGFFCIYVYSGATLIT
jgi:hypothetical protein